MCGGVGEDKGLLKVEMISLGGIRTSENKPWWTLFYDLRSTFIFNGVK